MFGWKNLSIFFITPVQSSHHSSSFSCWRQCGSVEGNHYHLFWDCPIILTFCQKIHTELESVFETKITFNWDKLFFGWILSISTNYQTKYLLGILSIAARKAITRKWLKPDIPSLEDWYDIIHDIFVMERITFSVRLQLSKFEKVWEKWKRYISQKWPFFVWFCCLWVKKKCCLFSFMYNPCCTFYFYFWNWKHPLYCLLFLLSIYIYIKKDGTAYVLHQWRL